MEAKERLLQEAEESIFSFGCGDASEKVSKLNARIGIAKIIFTLEKRRIDSANTICIFTPDGGITRNKSRWEAGFGYGCLIRWPSLDECGKLITFPEVKPNACGVLVARVSEVPPPQKLWERLDKIKKKGLFLEGAPVKLNLGVSNHFVEVCSTVKSTTSRIPEGSSVLLIHTSPSEFKSELYNFEYWRDEGGIWEDTPWGKILVLEEEVAAAYFRKYKDIESFSKRKRIEIAKRIFGEIEVISNCTHQGLSAPNMVRLGLYDTQESLGNSRSELFPVALRSDLHVYLFKGKQNLSEEVIKREKCYSSACRRGVLDFLTSSNILPHGGGYEIPLPSEGWSIFENGKRRMFRCQNGEYQFIFSSPSELPYNYRGLEVLEKINSLDLGEQVAELKQIYTLKY